MLLRPYQKEDSDALCQMLKEEGMKPYQMRYADGGHETFVMVDDEAEGKTAGFFTITPLRQIYFLQHFCLGEGYRTLKGWRAIERFMRGVLIAEKRCPIVIMSAPRDDERMKRMIEMRYHKQPYEETEAVSFFSINILEDVKDVRISS